MSDAGYTGDGGGIAQDVACSAPALVAEAETAVNLSENSRLESQAWRLENRIRDYAWGSLDGMQQLLGISNPQRKPQAEIWLGAHPLAPSTVVVMGGRLPLDQQIKQDPEYWLGESRQTELPFLFKVLSAGKPLSLQVHPSLVQAQTGFAREQQSGVPLSAGHRNYKDANHKPELMLAMSEFTAMAGFRAPYQIAGLFAELDIGILAPWAERLLREGEAALQPLYVWLLSLESAACGELVDAVCAAAASLEPLIHDTLLRLSDCYPGDAGVLSPLLLNLIRLQPGEAIFLDAGLPHAYIEGTGLEIMACSDNVLRGGLTPKHIDIEELIRVTCFKQQPVKVQRAEGTAIAGERAYPVPVSDFSLSLLRVTAGQLVAVDNQGLEILLCVEGEVTVTTGPGCSLTLARGESCVLPAAVSGYQVSGQGELARSGYQDRFAGPLPGRRRDAAWRSI